jgi:hypothetical protein
MIDLTATIRALLAMLREHPDLLDDQTNRDMLHELVLVVRDALDDANSADLHAAVSELTEGDQTSADL